MYKIEKNKKKSLKNVQNGKIQNFAGSLLVGGTRKCKTATRLVKNKKES
jgi:hypothetical protein